MKPYAGAISAASDGSLADVYVDVRRLIDQSGGPIDPQARPVLQNAGIDPSEATAVASVGPGAGRIAVIDQIDPRRCPQHVREQDVRLPRLQLPLAFRLREDVRDFDDENVRRQELMKACTELLTELQSLLAARLVQNPL